MVSYKQLLKILIMIAILVGVIAFVSLFSKIPTYSIANCIDDVEFDDLMTGSNVSVNGQKLSFTARAFEDWHNRYKLSISWFVESSSELILGSRLDHIYAYGPECWNKPAVKIDSQSKTTIEAKTSDGPRWEFGRTISTAAKLNIDGQLYYLLTRVQIHRVE